MALRAGVEVLSCLLIILLFALPAPSETSEVTWALGGTNGWSGGTFNNTTFSSNPGALLLAKGLHLLWGVRYDRSGRDVATAVAVDSQDNVIVTGHCRLGRDAYCTVKFDRNGRVLWVREYSTGTTERASDVAVDSQDNIIVAGYSVTGGYIYHLIKYDSGGRELWSRVYNGGEFGRACAVAVDPWDNIIVTGLSNFDLYTLKYTPDGRLLWARRLDGGGTEEAAAVDIDSQGNIVVAGGSNRLRRSADDGNYYLVKFDPQGNVLWERDYGGGESDVAQGVAIDSQDEIIVTGYSEWNGDYDYWTLKLDSQGRPLWMRRLDSGGRELAFAVAVDRFDNVIVTGTASRGGNKDLYTAKYDPQGRLLWAAHYDCCAEEAAYGVATDSKGNILVAGSSLGDYQLLKYSDGYLPQGSYASSIHSFGGWAKLESLEAETSLYGQELLAEIETSDDRFITVKRTCRLALVDGHVRYDISDLGRARYARIRLYFRTEDPQHSPLLHSLVIKATAG
jgi:uncharacterized delta-60 repeat protein